ncbi:hypothetical protein ACU4GD_15110 [Cupriavidus basilensis]
MFDSGESHARSTVTVGQSAHRQPRSGSVRLRMPALLRELRCCCCWRWGW